VLRALAVNLSLHGGRNPRRGAAGRPVIHGVCSEIFRGSDQGAGLCGHSLHLLECPVLALSVIIDMIDQFQNSAKNNPRGLSVN
jgi:hypothetical protein